VIDDDIGAHHHRATDRALTARKADRLNLLDPGSDSQDDLIGVIYADNRIRTAFTDGTNLLRFRNQAAVAIENACLFGSVRCTRRRSELKTYGDVFASIASGVITTDLSDRITLTNGAAEAILGQSRSDLIGCKVGDVALLKEMHLPRYLELVRQSNKQIVGLEFSPELPSRGTLTLSFNLSPLKDAEVTTQGVAIVMEDLTETRRLEAQRRLFERMVSPAVIDQLDPSELQLGGKRAQITTLFADMRGFTSLSERYAPEELVSVLNRYLGAAAEAILGEGGTIDKFLGDAIMAFFNAPIPQKDHTLRAMRAALSMRAAVSAVQKELPAQFQLSFGTGIHSGEAVLGLIGTQKRMEYTVIGDSVNIAKRLQENANPGQILISVQVYEQVRNQVLTQQVTPVVAKGKSEPIRVYELLGLKPTL
jgi:PAS domain S-box-containing protein